MKKVTVLIGFVFLFLSSLSFSNQGTVTAKALIIRESPTKSAKQIGVIAQNSKVEILSKDGPKETINGITANWYQVKFNNVTGWCFGGFVSEGVSLNDVLGQWPTHMSPPCWVLKLSKDSTYEYMEAKYSGASTSVGKYVFDGHSITLIDSKGARTKISIVVNNGKVQLEMNGVVFPSDLHTPASGN